MSKKHLEPAASIIAKIGASRIAEITGKHPTRVYRWRLSKEQGGTGGYVPHEDAEKLLRHVFEDGLSLCPSDFFVIDEVQQSQDGAAQ